MNEILLFGDSFVAGQRLDDVVGELVRIFSRASAVGFRENSSATVIDHVSLQASAACRSARRVDGVRSTENKKSGKREIVLQRLCRDCAFAAAERRTFRLIRSLLLTVIVGVSCAKSRTAQLVR